jgi:hypothetical protein
MADTRMGSLDLENCSTKNQHQGKTSKRSNHRMTFAQQAGGRMFQKIFAIRRGDC